MTNVSIPKVIYNSPSQLVECSSYKKCLLLYILRKYNVLVIYFQKIQTLKFQNLKIDFNDKLRVTILCFSRFLSNFMFSYYQIKLNVTEAHWGHSFLTDL